MSVRGDELDQFRREAGLTRGELFFRYFSLGGMTSAYGVEAICVGALEPSAHDRDVIAQALNDRFVDLHRDHRVPYADEL